MQEAELRAQLVEAVLGLLRPEIEEMIEQRVERRLPKPSPWLNVNEAAAYLKITPQAVRKRVYAGRLPARYDAGGKMRFRREDLDGSVL